MDPKILLVNPPFKYLMTPPILPMGLLNLGTILLNHGFETKIIDLIAEKNAELRALPDVQTPDEFLQEFKKFDPDIVGITSCTENYPITLSIAQLCKKENEAIKIMLGGSHVSFQSIECLTNNPMIDLIAIGETEHVIIDIIQGIFGKKDLNGIHNVAYRENGSIKNSEVCTVPELDALPAPNFDLIKDKYYPPHMLHLEFSRGCPYRCNFCSLSPIAPEVRFFPIKRILEILHEFEERYKQFNFFITDPTFLLNHKHVRSFLDEIQAQKIQLPQWDFQTRVNLVNREILNELKNANAYEITLGIEDIHDSVLQANGKHQTFTQIERALKLIKDLYLKSHSNFIIGLASQTKEQALENIVYSSKLDRFNFSVLKPFPGTSIFDDPIKFGFIILSNSWDRYITYEIVMNSNVFPVEAQKEIRELAVRHYAKEHIERDLLNIYEYAENKFLLRAGFDQWYKRWKADHYSGWS